MDFYVEPAFFIIAAVLCVPALACGLAGSARGRKAWGLVASAVMLALLFSRTPQELAFFGLFLVVSCAAAFFVLHLFTHGTAHRVALYRVALAVALLPLVCAKVSAAFDANLLGFAGISYLTFKTLQVLIEIRDGLIEELRFLDFLYFLLFFPVFTSGPIMRSRDFVQQLHASLPRGAYLELLAGGVFAFVIGALYSFVAAPLAEWAEWFVPEALGTGTPALGACGQLLQALFYGLYLFFNFAGYSFLAQGLGAFFGVRVPRNFRAPFASTDIKDFWNRWHITLSFWLRDFVFMRITRAFMKRKVFNSRITTACVGYVCNMTLMGLWHGLTVDFIAYGLFHGMLLAGCELFQKKSAFYKKHRKSTWFKALSWGVTMVCVFFGFALFSGQVSTCVLGVING